MVSLLRQRGIQNPALLQAFSDVPREQFVLPEQLSSAYADSALPIECGQTISQPFIVALMIDAARINPEDHVLEVGTGSGYAAAILSRMARSVISLERIPELADLAQNRLQAGGYDNVEVKCCDGTLGWPQAAPYQAILVAAAAPEVPRTLCDQLTIGGRLIIPAGPDPNHQQLLCVTRTGPQQFKEKILDQVRFVPLIGEAGWDEED